MPYSSFISQVDNSNTGMLFKVKKHDDQYIHTFCKGKLLHALGLEPGDIIGKTVFDIFPAHLAGAKHEFCEKAWTGECVQYEAFYKNVYYLTTLTPVFENGVVTEIAGTAFNVSGIKAREIELRERQMIYHSVVTTMSEGILILEKDGKVTTLNDNVEKLTGMVSGVYDEETAAQLGIQLFDEFGKPLPYTEWPAFLSIETGLRFQNVEVSVLKKNGHTRWFSLNSSPITISGKAAALVSFFEITKQKQQEMELLETLAFQKTLLDNLDNGIVVIDNTRQVTMINKKALETLGLTGQIGDYTGLFAPDFHSLWKDQEFIDQLVISTMVDGNIKSAEIETVHGKILEATYIPFNFKKKFSGHIFEFIDITERKKLESSLIMSKELAEQANMAKSEFLSKMSHELRTPLNGVLGFAQLLEMDTQLDEIHLDYVQEIIKGGRHLLQLINEILDLSRIETGKIKINLETVNAYDTINECIKNIEAVAMLKNISVIREIEECKDVYVSVDPIRIKQVLYNLLDNAVKYNQINGEVKISVTCAEDKLIIHIKDSGEGISNEEHKNIFKPFYRIEQTKIEGNGIGLPLAKQLVVLMGGDMGVSSVLGQGSDFWFSLNVGAPEKDIITDHVEHPELHINHSRSTRILYVEDNEANINLLNRIINLLPGYNITVGRTGEEGIKIAQKEKFDLILLDLNLPDMNGQEVFDCLKRFPKTLETPIVALSANAMPDEIKKTINQGFTNYLTKPIEIKEFLTLLNDIVEPTK
ncbi:PAS domain-containing hybrid sensor histidine kinase/response regulator [Bacillus sp. T33-2]|uniref:PAS domain-containing hybrid sensor histidine kinase/response regulator n=1 Tax=Bacillus sp. T33-2 TaxID=2054168 RepID=UPI000C7722B6|nr:PAS domain-containing hybrid sensor histidine kinase/response regulator [Bacillus sp. T33-2]PLR95723.1 hypothetical protein CVD19_13340 [Bacillus sp. T33-2]